MSFANLNELSLKYLNISEMINQLKRIFNLRKAFLGTPMKMRVIDLALK